MPNLYLDLETIPDQRPGARERVAASLKAPGTYKRPESIAEWIKENAEREWQRTALDPLDGGEIAVIGWAVDNSIVKSCSRTVATGGLTKEGDLLFVALASIEACFPVGWQGRDAVLVGSNVREFDLPFLVHRCLINGVTLPPWLRDMATNSKPGGGAVVDTQFDCLRPGNYRDPVKLLTWCRAYGIAHDDSFTGADVWAAWSKGEYERVCQHCRDDVQAVRAVHQKLEGLWR